MYLVFVGVREFFSVNLHGYRLGKRYNSPVKVALFDDV